MSETTRNVRVKPNYDSIAWQWMRYSGILLIPLAWIHILIQDVLVGVHKIDLDYVALRWSMWGWRVFDFLLLAFAFAHGMNGLRQVLTDYITDAKWRTIASWTIFFFWVVISLIGALAIIGGVRIP